jgi:hypothetical protein
MKQGGEAYSAGLFSSFFSAPISRPFCQLSCPNVDFSPRYAIFYATKLAVMTPRRMGYRRKRAKSDMHKGLLK